MTDVLHRCILQILDASTENTENVARLFLALIAHCARDQDSKRAIKDVETGCSCENYVTSPEPADIEPVLYSPVLVQSEFELAKMPAMACLTVRGVCSSSIIY